MKHDPNFGGGMPEPKPQYMQELIEIIKKKHGYVGFAMMVTAIDTVLLMKTVTTLHQMKLWLFYCYT